MAKRTKKKAPEPIAPAPAETQGAAEFIPNSRTRWVIYGIFIDEHGGRRAITKEDIRTEEEARVLMVTHYMTKGRNLTGVLIRLDNGKDVNGERHVVGRAGEGRAWWE